MHCDIPDFVFYRRLAKSRQDLLQTKVAHGGGFNTLAKSLEDHPRSITAITRLSLQDEVRSRLAAMFRPRLPKAERSKRPTSFEPAGLKRELLGPDHDIIAAFRRGSTPCVLTNTSLSRLRSFEVNLPRALNHPASSRASSEILRRAANPSIFIDIPPGLLNPDVGPPLEQQLRLSANQL